MSKVGLIVPTLNAGSLWESWLKTFEQQTRKPDCLLVIDSSSNDDTVGGFPVDTIMNEDTYVAGKMLLSGWKIAYCADAQVFHSHDYSFLDEFKRYFDIGVFHTHTSWLQQTFGGASGEGFRFVISEMRYLMKHAPWLIPSAVLRTGLKWLGFRLGSLHRELPRAIRRCFSLHKTYWLRTLP